MDSEAIIEHLRTEADNLRRCIRAFEELQRLWSGQPRRGRPRKRITYPDAATARKSARKRR